MKPATAYSIGNDVITILSEMTEVPAEDILPEMTLKGNLCIGETLGNGEFLDLQAKLERHFNILIPVDILPRAEALAELKVKNIQELFIALLLKS